MRKKSWCEEGCAWSERREGVPGVRGGKLYLGEGREDVPVMAFWDKERIV